MIQHHVSRNLVGVSLSCASGIRKQILIWVYNKLQSLLTVVREHQQNADLTRHIHKRAFVEVQVLQKRISSTLLELKKKKNGCIGMSEKVLPCPQVAFLRVMGGWGIFPMGGRESINECPAFSAVHYAAKENHLSPG